MTNAQIEWVAETDNRKFGIINASWNDQVRTFSEAGASLVLPEDVIDAYLAGYNGSSRTRLIAAKVKGKKTILYKGNDLVTPAGAREIMLTHVLERYPVRSTDFYDALERITELQKGLEPEDKIALAVTKSGDHSWSEEMAETRFVLGPRKKEYFEEKSVAEKRKGITFYDLKADFTRHATFNYVWVGQMHLSPVVVCKYKDLHQPRDSALGVLVKTAEGGSHPTSRYDLTTIRDAYSRAIARYLTNNGMTGLADKFESLPTAVLEELRKLPQ